MENNPKSKGKIINSLIKKENNHKDIPDIEINGLKIKDNVTKANNFNEEYTTGVYNLLQDEFSNYDIKVQEIEYNYREALKLNTNFLKTKTGTKKYEFNLTNSH